MGLLNSRAGEPIFADVIVKYFREEEKISDDVAIELLEDLLKYDDILEEFTNYLRKRTYDLENAIEINGYTAKKISDINQQFSPLDVYLTMKLLREDPEEANIYIKSGLPFKDMANSGGEENSN